MLSFLQKNQPEEKDLKSQLDVSGVSAKEVSEFIPYFAHFDPDTIITKNGELLKIIKINSNNFGLNYESAQEYQHTVRETIRSAINNAVKTDDISFWIHMLRRREPIKHEGQYGDEFASYVYDKWKISNNWQFQYYNEIYISILHDGQEAILFDQKNFQNVIFPKKNRTFRNKFLLEAHEKLNNVCDDIIETIRTHYDAKFLCIKENIPEDIPELSSTPIFYSEPLQFLGKLCNLNTRPYPLAKTSLDKALSNYEVMFGYNALENKLDTGEKRFAGVLTLKQYVETPPETIDRILQLPVEMIISHAFHYVPTSVALKPLDDQMRIFKMSEDSSSITQTGLRALLSKNQQNPTDFGKQQISIMVLTDDYKQLESEVSKVQQAFASLGLLAVREDIKLEECYWATMPGNFEFLRRQDFILSDHLAGLCRLNLFPNGNLHNNHWGDAVALMPTIVDSPYFFNFHHKDNGHTILFDFNSFQDQYANATLGLLVTLCMQYTPRLYIFDEDQGSRLLLDRIKGNYHIFDQTADEVKFTALNPFSIEDTPRNQSFLHAWCVSLIETNIALTEQQANILRESITSLFAGPETSRHLSGLLDVIRSHDEILADSFSAYHGQGQYAGIFDAHTEQLDLATALHGFDMSKNLRTGPVGIPLFSYLMHRIINEINGQPTIIVLKDAWSLLENDFFAPRLESLLEMLKQNNVMVISTTNKPTECLETNTLRTLMQCCASKIFVPDDITMHYQSDALGISPHDSDTMRRMARQQGDFLLKQGNETIGLRVSFKHMEDAHSIFSGDIKNLIAAGGPFAHLPKYY